MIHLELSTWASPNAPARQVQIFSSLGPLNLARIFFPVKGRLKYGTARMGHGKPEPE
jgi:hypothetical protein